METKPVIIASYTDGARERLRGLLEDEGLDGANLIENISQVDKTGLFLVVWSLEQGFKTDKFTSYFGARRFRRTINSTSI